MALRGMDSANDSSGSAGRTRMSGTFISVSLLISRISSPNQILQRFRIGPEHEIFMFIVLLTFALLIYLLALCAVVVVWDTCAHLRAERKANRPPPWKICRTCGYNLIASQYWCPECGKPIPPWPKEKPRIRLVRGFVVVERNGLKDEG
jgi:hypothetical protein